MEINFAFDEKVDPVYARTQNVKRAILLVYMQG
jgi:hypothetical protein